MPKRVIRQPNGLLALWSTIVDHVIYYDCTPEEMTDILINKYDCGPKTAAEKVRAGIEDWKPWTIGVKGSGLDRWNDDIPMMVSRSLDDNSEASARAILIECGMTLADVDKLYADERAERAKYPDEYAD